MTAALEALYAGQVRPLLAIIPDILAMSIIDPSCLVFIICYMMVLADINMLVELTSIKSVIS